MTGSLGCAGCGDCCNPVKLTIDTADRLNAYWLRRQQGMRVPRGHRFNRSFEFAAKHWLEIWRRDGQVGVRCDFYDPATASCTTYEQRPPVCSDFPWYGRDTFDVAEPRCSYWLDVPPADRPADARPLIPITAIRRPA